MTQGIWYWASARYDHMAVGLVACAGDNGRIHYAQAGELVTTACDCKRQPDNLQLLDGPKIVDCRLCAAVAKWDRGLIAQRVVRPVITDASRMAFRKRRKNARP